MTKRIESAWVASVGLTLCALLAIPSASWAQAAKAKKAAPKLGTEIEEIIVTAQKREESLQETPLSVTAFTGEMLEQKGVSDVLALGENVPNLRISTHPGESSGVTITMRGLGQANPDATLQPAVGMYVDGVYIAKILGSNLDLEDLERVEVLRGPQGTLYGRNTIGGAVNFITRKPTEESSVTARAEVGNYDTFKSRVTANVPLIGKNGFFRSDTAGTLSLRQTVGYKTHDGYFTNNGTSSANFNNENRVYTTTALRWQPINDLTIDYSFEYHRYRDHPPAFQATYVYPGSAATRTPNDLRPYVHTNRVDSLTSNMLLLSDLKTYHRLLDDGNHRMHILTGAWHLGQVGALGDVTVKSIASYRSFVSQSDNDFDGSPLPLWGSERYSDNQHWSEELQWVGTAPRVHYVLGGYYYGEYVSYTSEQVLFAGTSNSVGKNLIKTESYAPFGQVTYTPPILNDKLSVTGGIRYTQEQVHTDRFYRNVRNPAASFTASVGKAFGGTDGISPMGNIAYQWTDSLMTYFRVSRGFKGGGFNGSASSAISFRKPFDPETLWAYEGGFRSEWLDKRLRLNATGFYSDYSDLQVSVFRATLETGSVSYLTNAASAEVWGMEFDGTAIPFRGAEVTVGYSFLAPKFTEWLDQKFDASNRPIYDPSGNPVLEDVKNQRTFPYAPRHQLTAGVSYTAPPTNTGTFSAHLDTYWQDKNVFIVNNLTPGAQADEGWAFAVVNGRLQFVGIPLQKGSLDLAVFAQNLFDRKYRVHGIDFGASVGWAGNIYGAPRTFGLQLTYNWNEG